MTNPQLPALRGIGPVKVNVMEPLSDLDQAMRLSDALSRSELVPRSLYGKPANILHVILTGQALGLHWTEALRVIYSPGPGQIGMRAQFLLSQLRKAGHSYSFEDDPDGQWVKFSLDRGDTKEHFGSTFSIEDAIQAGLAKRNASGELIALSRDNKPLPWMQYTRRMLRWRAVSDCVSFAAPEVLLGFEVEGDMPPEPPQQVNLAPAAPAPPEPGTGQAATDAGQVEQVRAELHRLNAELKVPAAEIARPEGGDSGEIARPGPAPEDEAFALSPEQEAAIRPLLGARTPAEAFVQPAAEEDESPADAAKRAEVAAAFGSVNWPVGRYRADVARACSVFCRRKITASKDMKMSEATRLVAELGRIRSAGSEAALEARMADLADQWAHAWQAADPAGFGDWQEEGK